MFNKKIRILLFTSGILLFTACGSSSKSVPQPYIPLDLTHRSDSFKQGAHDGCSTASETYKKNHELFKNDFDYNEGWWAGRRNCEGQTYAEY